MWILLLILQINLNNHSEYWVGQDSLNEHFESHGSIVLKLKSFGLITDYLAEDNLFNTPKKFKIFPFLTVSSAHIKLEMGYIQKIATSGMLINQTNDIQFKRFRYLKGLSVLLQKNKGAIAFFTGNPYDYTFDGLTYTSSQDSQDILRGITLKGERGFLYAEAGYIRLNHRNMPASYAFDEIMGTEIGISKNRYSFTLDFALKRGVNYITYTRKKGYGIFGSLEIIPSSWNLLIQFASYDSINFNKYNLPPVPLRTEILPTEGMSDRGGSLTVYYPFSHGNLEIGAGSLFDLKETNPISPFSGKAFQEAYLQADLYLSRGISITIKPGYERRLRIEPEYIFLKNFYLQSDLDLSSLFPVEIFSRADRFTEDTLIYSKFTLNTTFYPTENLNLQLLLEYATKNVARYNFEHFWPSIGLSWNIEGGYISIFYGKQRGGLVCSGGMCRITPRFNGLKLVFEKSI